MITQVIRKPLVCVRDVSAIGFLCVIGAREGVPCGGA